MCVALTIILLPRNDSENDGWQARRQEKVGKTATDNRFSSPQALYKNLSCPFEWTKYSCFHQQRQDLAEKGYQLVQDDKNQRHAFDPYWQSRFFDIPNTNNERSKLVLVGDSTVRQVFIALGCFFWQRNQIEDYFVDWAPNYWPCHNTPNCFDRGSHSGFNVGQIRIRDGGPDVYFVPHGGSLEKAQPKLVQDRWIPEWRTKEQLTFQLDPPHGEQYVLGHRDIIVYNIGLHLNPVARKGMYNHLNQLGDALVTSTNGTNSTLVYLTTIAQHFQRRNGMYGSEITTINKTGVSANGCLKAIPFNPRRRDEIQAFQERNIDLLIHVEDESMGEYHIGGSDCTHHCMPGVPDVTARHLLDELARYFESKEPATR